MTNVVEILRKNIIRNRQDKETNYTLEPIKTYNIGDTVAFLGFSRDIAYFIRACHHEGKELHMLVPFSLVGGNVARDQFIFNINSVNTGAEIEGRWRNGELCYRFSKRLLGLHPHKLVGNIMITCKERK